MLRGGRGENWAAWPVACPAPALMRVVEVALMVKWLAEQRVCETEEADDTNELGRFRPVRVVRQSVRAVDEPVARSCVREFH